ncbi:MAG: SPFH domain-containing protein [Bacteroidales bacterium]|nr:SPFH domain-containing protein [Bacteroidales bacterium]
MGLFNKKEGGLMDVIRCDEENYLVWKWRPAGQAANSTNKENAIRYGSTLHVKDGEMAVFVYKQQDGTQQDYIMGPYNDTIKTANFPVLTSIVGAAFGGASPFPAEVYFFNLQGNNQIKFAVPYFPVADPRFLDFTVPVAVRGQLTFNLTDVKTFIKLNRLTDFSLEQLNNQIKGMVTKFAKNFVTNCPADYGISVLQLERKIMEISDLMQARLTPQLADDFGINLKRLDISAIEIDKESEDYKEFVHVTKEQQKIIAEQAGERVKIDTKMYEKSASLGIESQNLQAHTINKQAEVLSAAANNLGQMSQMNLGGDGGGFGMNPAGMMMGMAMGGAMGGQMANMMNGMGQAQQQAMQQPQQQMAPPPMPGAVNVTYMVSVNGQQFGPYNMQQLQQMVQNGQLTAQTYVWKQGMANWDLAGNVQELATLFGAVPPPMPPTPPMP